MTFEGHIRLAEAADLAGAADLLLLQLAEHGIRVRRAHVMQRVRAAVGASGDGATLLVAHEATGPAGHLVGVAYVSFAEPLEHEGTVAWLEELYVVPHRRDHGIGSRLLDAVIDHAERRGCVAVELETKPGHERAGHLYVRHGFRDLARTHYARPLAAWDW
jgi:GNAT superfamily N-acetyltransferase